MHISYKSEISESPIIITQLTPGYSDRMWQFIRFSVVTGMIFLTSFFVLNFGAYKQIITNLVNPEAKAKAQAVLGSLAGENSTLNEGDFLEVLPDQNDKVREYSWLNTPVVPTDNRLVIPKIGKSVPLVGIDEKNIVGENWHELENQIQDGLRDGIVHYPGTANPGEFGNVFLTGHSSYYPWDPGLYKDVFATLHELEVGDRYYIYYNQKKYTYEIIEKNEVQPSATEVLAQPTNKKISTLMTCSPVGTTLRRLIVKAEQV